MGMGNGTGCHEILIQAVGFTDGKGKGDGKGHAPGTGRGDAGCPRPVCGIPPACGQDGAVGEPEALSCRKLREPPGILVGRKRPSCKEVSCEKHELGIIRITPGREACIRMAPVGRMVL